MSAEGDDGGGGGRTSSGNRVSVLDDADWSSLLIPFLHRSSGGVSERARGGERERERERLRLFDFVRAPKSLSLIRRLPRLPAELFPSAAHRITTAPSADSASNSMRRFVSVSSKRSSASSGA
jgi:hypothetical protein